MIKCRLKIRIRRGLLFAPSGIKEQNMAEVILTNVYKAYPGNPEPTVKDVNLEIKDKEFMVLVGPSGCGKSTTLRMIAGLEEITDGTISIGGNIVNDIPPKNRDIAMVFQNYALYPHMTVYENMAFGLRLRHFKKDEIDRRVREAAAILGLDDPKENYLQRRPKHLSGGQRQRVAVGRAIVRQPKAFLFDEPLSNLDAKMRVQMRAEISRLHRRLQSTMIYVTHDQVEAMTMGDRICVMRDGIIQQVADPITLYNYPNNKFVAGFIGTPPMNFFEGRLHERNGRFFFNEGSFELELKEEAWQEKLKKARVTDVCFGLRPENIGSEMAEQNPNLPRIKARVEVIEPMGAETHVYLSTGNSNFVAKLDPFRKLHYGEDMELALYMPKAHLFRNDTEEAIV